MPILCAWRCCLFSISGYKKTRIGVIPVRVITKGSTLQPYVYSKPKVHQRKPEKRMPMLVKKAKAQMRERALARLRTYKMM